MERFTGKKWKDIEEKDKKELLENAICIDCKKDSLLLNGEQMIVFLKHLRLWGVYVMVSLRWRMKQFYTILA